MTDKTLYHTGPQTLQKALAEAEQMAHDANLKVAELKAVEYLWYIAEHGTVVWAMGFRSMADVMWLLESGWIDYTSPDGENANYFVTMAGRAAMREWMDVERGGGA